MSYAKYSPWIWHYESLKFYHDYVINNETQSSDLTGLLTERLMHERPAHLNVVYKTGTRVYAADLSRVSK